jgi:hypothetical protein
MPVLRRAGKNEKGTGGTELRAGAGQAGKSNTDLFNRECVNPLTRHQVNQRFPNSNNRVVWKPQVSGRQAWLVQLPLKMSFYKAVAEGF